MTSQKSLKNKVNTKDFLRSLAGSLLFPAIALVVLFAGVTGPVIAEIVSPEHKSQMANAVSYFLSDSSMFYYMTNMLQVGMVICGMLTAVKQFYFVMNKKQVNVYLSLGITRIRLFVNRTVSALISLFASVLIPMLLIYIVNIASFGMSSHLTGVFLYVTFVLFICALAGFAIGAFAVALSGNVFEAGLTCATVSLFGYILPDLLREMSNILLRGYVYYYGTGRWTGLFSPFTFVMDLGATRSTSNLVVPVDTFYEPLASQMRLLIRDVPADKYKVPEELAFDSGYLLPLFIMSLLSVAVMVLAAVLFKKRKAEHANSMGHFKISAFINSAFVFCCAVFFLSEMLYGYNRGVVFVLMLVAIAIVPLLAYFIIQLILTRKIKVALRSLIPGAVLSVLAVLCVVTLHTGVFGLYNKTPDKADIKSVAISAVEHPVFWKDVSLYDEENIFYSDNSADIDMVLSVFDKIKDDEYRDDYFSMVTVALQYDNGKVKFRSFPVYTEEAYEAYMKAVYESNYFDEILKDVILGKAKEDENGYYAEYGYYEPYMTQYFRDRLWYYLDSDSLMDIENEFLIQPSEDMLNALYNDLSKMSYEQLFKNDTRPLGLLTYDMTMPLQAEDIVKKMDMDSYYWYDEDYEEYKGLMLGDSAIYLYPEMTETLKFLTDGQYEVSSEKREVKEILYTDSKIQLPDVISQYKKAQENAQVGWEYYYDYSSYLFDRSNGYYTMIGDNLEFYVPKDIKALDLLKEVYTVSEHPLISVTEQSKIDSIIKASVPFYLTVGDEGRYAYAVYDDGTILPYYIPQSNLDVLK